MHLRLGFLGLRPMEVLLVIVDLAAVVNVHETVALALVEELRGVFASVLMSVLAL
jgi:hypothetical protein